MVIHRFFYEECLADSVGKDIALSPMESAHALRVLRLRDGDAVSLLDGRGYCAEAVLVKRGDDGGRSSRQAICRVTSVSFVQPPQRRIHLYVAPPKSKNMEFILKAATELGVWAIHPVHCRFGVSLSDGTVKETWEQQLIAAVKQSRNPWLPQLYAMESFQSALESSPRCGIYGAVPTEQDGTASACMMIEDGDCAVWVGPEGGFSSEEEDALHRHGLTPLTIGRWTLRAETAAIALLSISAFHGA